MNAHTHTYIHRIAHIYIHAPKCTYTTHTTHTGMMRASAHIYFYRCQIGPKKKILCFRFADRPYFLPTDPNFFFFIWFFFLVFDLTCNSYGSNRLSVKRCRSAACLLSPFGSLFCFVQHRFSPPVGKKNKQKKQKKHKNKQLPWFASVARAKYS